MNDVNIFTEKSLNTNKLFKLFGKINFTFCTSKRKPFAGITCAEYKKLFISLKFEQ